jgi:hypothetical protein
VKIIQRSIGFPLAVEDADGVADDRTMALISKSVFPFSGISASAFAWRWL